MGDQTSKFILEQKFVLLHVYYPDFVHSLATESLVGFKSSVSYFQYDKWPTVSFIVCKYHKPLIDSIILTIRRSIWKSKRKDHINLEQQAMIEVRRSAEKEKRVHIQ